MRMTIAEMRRKADGDPPLAMITCYDYTSALLCSRAGLSCLLVGDSLGQVMLGHPDTVRVTLDDMVRHTAAVVRGAPDALVIADLPFLTYANPDQAVASARKLMQEGGAQAVKLEGGLPVVDTIRRLVDLGVPTMAHLGFTPQSLHQIGVRVQGRDAQAAARLIREAEAVAQAGAFAVVLELVPAELAAEITERIQVPTIGIGAGAGCSGQVQVWSDVLGLTETTFRHAARFAEAGEVIRQGLSDYVTAVRERSFPGPANAAKIDRAIVAEALSLAGHG